jgi:hypothetical protein
LALFSHLHHLNSRKLLDHILRRVVLDENLRSGSSRAKRDDNAQRCPQGEAQGRVNPARPTNTEKSAFWRFFRICALIISISLTTSALPLKIIIPLRRQ